MKKLLTLCIIHKHPKILLAMKKRGFGAGRWNGLGGKLNPGETIEEAAKREVREEAGIELKNLEKMGIIEFEFQGNPQILEVHVFKSDSFSGVPVETEEMRPEWFEVGAIPYKEMWPDDIFWIPLFLAGKKFTGRYLFGEGDKILEQRLVEVETI